MKQNKAEKLLAGVLSISLAMGVSVMPAFAASGETYADMDSVVIKKNYELANEGTFSPAETFSFDIEADNVTDASVTVTGSIANVKVSSGEIVPVLVSS